MFVLGINGDEHECGCVMRPEYKPCAAHRPRDLCAGCGIANSTDYYDRCTFCETYRGRKTGVSRREGE